MEEEAESGEEGGEAPKKGLGGLNKKEKERQVGREGEGKGA
jgi:hypothetical protein